MKKSTTKKKTASAPAARPGATTLKWARRASSVIHGSGLYAQRGIPAGTEIIEYVGDRITKTEANRRDAARRERREAGGDGCVYLFELNKRYDIDGDVRWNTARLINHSCEPNCQPQNKRGHIWIVALRDIPAGAELSYDYGFDFEGWREHPCRCGTPSCVGYILKKSQRWRVRKIQAKEAAAREATA